MAYKRGSGTVQVELARIQSWVERADPDLYGENGQKGIIEEHQERMMREADAKEANDKSTKRLVALCAIFGAITPVCRLIEYLHSIWK